MRSSSQADYVVIVYIPLQMRFGVDLLVEEHISFISLCSRQTATTHFICWLRFLISASSSHLLVTAGGATHLERAGSLLYVGTTERDEVFGRGDDARRPRGIWQTVEDSGQR